MRAAAAHGRRALADFHKFHSPLLGGDFRCCRSSIISQGYRDDGRGAPKGYRRPACRDRSTLPRALRRRNVARRRQFQHTPRDAPIIRHADRASAGRAIAQAIERPMHDAHRHLLPVDASLCLDDADAAMRCWA